jgi:hypothetical protein
MTEPSTDDAAAVVTLFAIQGLPSPTDHFPIADKPGVGALLARIARHTAK